MEANTPRILVIEDDPHIRRVLRLTLEAEGMVVSETVNARAGLLEARLVAHDLIILDLGLPDMDGVEVIRQLREWTELPVIVLSARSQEQTKVEALDLGADDYLTKPFGNPELVARIRANLRKRGRGANSQVAEFGDVSIDFALRQVTRAGLPVHLTPIEFKLLTALVMGGGKVMTHTYLLREVWGSGHAERNHYLRIHMGHLRQKLEFEPARPRHIVTEIGVGYRLVP